MRAPQRQGITYLTLFVFSKRVNLRGSLDEAASGFLSVIRSSRSWSFSFLDKFGNT